MITKGHHEEFVPYSLPLGYAMKGKHLSNNELCFLIDECRRKLKERGIPILCEVYDGQWQNLCMTDKDGKPLTELRLVKNTWQRVSKMSKNKCLQELILGTKEKKRDLEMMEKSERLQNGSTTYHNLKISRNEDFSLEALSTGGLTFSEPAIKYIRSVTTKSRPDLWEQSIQHTQSEDSAQEKKSATKGRLTGLTDSEKSIVHLLDNEIIRSLQDEIGEVSTSEENTLQTADNETNYEKELLQLALKHLDVNLLNDLISDLKEVNELKRTELQLDKLYPHILTDPFNITRKMTVQEILTVGKMLEQRTGRKFCKTNVSKAVNANIIAEAFLSQGFIQIPSKKERNCKNVRSLQDV